MSATHFTLEVVVQSGSCEPHIFKNASPDLTVLELTRELHSRLGLDGNADDWTLTYQGSVLDVNSQLRDCFPPSERPIQLVLARLTTTDDLPDLMESDFDIALESEMGDSSGEVSLEEDEAVLSLACEEGVEEFRLPEIGPECEVADLDYFASQTVAVQSRKTLTRRATVRYYSRMNPERVYPLLVLITRDMVEKIQQKGTDQRASGPFQVDVDIPIEIEPVLPGCVCYPPKITARLSKGELTATFRVVPHVLGTVDGASVTIRQDHHPLAEIALEVKVVQRTWAVLCGVVTFLLPALSAILKHFGLDFETQKDEGFSLYVSAARLVFDHLSPLVLTTGLAVITGLVWWFTRPRTRDVFWEIKKVGPAEKFNQIVTLMEANEEQGLTDLADLLLAFPAYQPARLLWAEWHYKAEDYAVALQGYQEGFRLGVTQAHHYLRASLAASKLGQMETALRILQEAEKVLRGEEITGVMCYNMGCYHARLGESNKALAYLRRAIAKGYTKATSYQNDPDLNPLRHLPEFQQLLTQNLTIHFRCGKCAKSLWAKTGLAKTKGKCPQCKARLVIPASS